MKVIATGLGTEFAISAYKAYGMFGGLSTRATASFSRQKGTL